MLSLSNVFDKDGMKDFLKKIKNFLNFKKDEIELIGEPKIDGISATLVYEKEDLQKDYQEEMVLSEKIFWRILKQ